MKEINYYKIHFLIGGNDYEEDINMRVVYYFDKAIIEEELEEMSIEYDLKSPYISLECNFNNPNKYISEEEFIAMRTNAPIYPLDMLFGEMTFTKNYHIRDYNMKGHIETQNEFLNEVCDVINEYCDLEATCYIKDNEKSLQEKNITYMYDIRPGPQEGLEEFIEYYTEGSICSNYMFDTGCYMFEDMWDEYGDEIFSMLNHVHGPTCLKWDAHRGECGYCGIDYIEVMEEGGYCNGVPEIVLDLMETCLFEGPRAVMYIGQRDNIDYRIIHDIIKSYGDYWEKGKYEKLIKNFNLIQKNEYIFKTLNYNTEDYHLYYKNYNELKRIIDNYQTLSRWNKIINKVKSEEITIGSWNDWDEKGYTEQPPIEERLCIINDDINSENKYAWLEVNRNDSHFWDIYDTNIDFTKLLHLNRNIKWNMEMLEQLEEIYN